MSVSEAQKRATAKFQRKTYDTIMVRLRKDSGEAERFKKLAQKKGVSLAELIKSLLRRESEKEGI